MTRALVTLCIALGTAVLAERNFKKNVLLNRLRRRTVDCETLSPRSCIEEKGCIWSIGACKSKTVLDQHSKALPFPRTCNDGKTLVECLDIAACATGVPDPTPTSRWAFVYTHSLGFNFTRITPESLNPLLDLAKRLGNTDVILIVPKVKAKLGAVNASMEFVPRNGGNFYHYTEVHEGAFGTKFRKRLERKGVKIMEVPWAIPPRMRLKPRPNECVSQDFLRLHVLGLEEYAAIAYYDMDMEFTGRGDPTLPIRCASKGHFLSTMGPLSPMNVGFFALKPSRGLKEAAIRLAQTADYDEEDGTGWARAGLAPNKPYLNRQGEAMAYPGAECGQGFLHTLFYKTDMPEVSSAFQHVGEPLPKARMIDKCVWNFQGDKDCKEQGQKYADCEKVVLIHKDGLACKKKQDQESLHDDYILAATAAMLEEADAADSEFVP